MSHTPAGWLPDPTGHYELRYWDGAQWTGNVSDRGKQATDPYVAAEPPPSPPGLTREAPGEEIEADDEGGSGSFKDLPIGARRQIKKGVREDDILGVWRGARGGGTTGSLVLTRDRVIIIKKDAGRGWATTHFPYAAIDSVIVSLGSRISLMSAFTELQITTGGSPGKTGASSRLTIRGELDRTTAPNTVLFGRGRRGQRAAHGAANRINELRGHPPSR